MFVFVLVANVPLQKFFQTSRRGDLSMRWFIS